MARRALLSEAWWQQATIIPDDEREIAKHYTLDRSDLDLIMRQNKASNRLGLACVLATLRYPGRPLADGEVLPAGVLRFLARQIGVDHHEVDRYFERPQTRREHLALLFDRMKMRPFVPSDVRALTGWLTPAAQTLRQADVLADMVVEELRRRRILLPARPALASIGPSFCPSGGRTQKCAGTRRPTSTKANPRTPWPVRCSSTGSGNCETGPSRVSSTGRPG